MTAPRTDRLAHRLGRHPITARRAGLWIGAFTLVVTVLSGFIIWLLDREEFPTAGSGMWWAVQTVTTVGYGDAVPTTAVGRITAAVVMVAGIGFVTVVTASITAVFIESARRRFRRESDESLDVRLNQIAERLDRIESRLQEGTGQEPG